MSPTDAANTIVGLLRSKNRCLEKFILLSEDFLKAAEGGKMDGLELFQSGREAHLKAMDLYDRKITELVPQVDARERTSALSKRVEAELNRKDALVRRVLEVDLRIMGCLEKAKSEIMKDIQGSRRSREMINKFKSGWVPESGEELDSKL